MCKHIHTDVYTYLHIYVYTYIGLFTLLSIADERGITGKNRNQANILTLQREYP